MRADLYEKSRQPGMRLIFRAFVTKVESFTFRQHAKGIILTVERQQLTPDECETLAVADGFETFAQMVDFWRKRVKKGRGRVNGQIVYWDYKHRFMKKTDECNARHHLIAADNPPPRPKLFVMPERHAS